MANKHNDYFNKKAQKGNYAPKTEKKKKFSFYLVVIAMVFCILGAILGSTAFIENRVAKATLDPVDTVLTFENSTVDNTYQYTLNSGVTTNIGLEDYLNVGWAGWNSDLGRVKIFNAPKEDTNYQIPYIQYTPFETTTITPFVTFNGSITLAPYTSYVVKMQLGATPTTIENISNFSFYFLGGEQVSITNQVKNTTIEYIENTPIRYIEFIVANSTADYLTYSSYRFNINFSNMSSLNYIRFHSISIEVADFSAGFNSGYQNGFIDGKQEGLVEGEEIGFDKGLKENNSFFSLISAVIDVPIKAFTSLFNFEVFGQNMTQFFLALFTFAVGLAVVRLIFG